MHCSPTLTLFAHYTYCAPASLQRAGTCYIRFARKILYVYCARPYAHTLTSFVCSLSHKLSRYAPSCVLVRSSVAYAPSSLIATLFTRTYGARSCRTRASLHYVTLRTCTLSFVIWYPYHSLLTSPVGAGRKSPFGGFSEHTWSFAPRMRYACGPKGPHARAWPLKGPCVSHTP